MDMSPLGRTDAKVSRFGLGVMTFGAQTDEKDAFRILDMAFEAGVTLFDTAENYPSPISPETQGRSEEILGQWIKARGVRDKVFVATKVAGPGSAAGNMDHIRGPNRRLDRANIVQAVDDSLRRLGIDVINLYQVHWAERAVTTLGRSRYSHLPNAPKGVPIEETLGALGEMVQAGKVRHLGVCNESPWGVSRYLEAARAKALPRIVTIQNGYHLLDRYFELGLAEIAMEEQIGLIAYSPLAGGLLTGKYGDAPKPIPGTRSEGAGYAASRFTEQKLRAVAAYTALARQNGLEPAAMALAFVRQQPFATSVLMAARTPEQLEQNLRAIDLKLAPDLVKQINAIHDEQPNPR